MSKICPYIEGEAPMARHDRRLETNLSYEAEMRDWCAENGVTLAIKNGGHHWRFTRVVRRGSNKRKTKMAGADWWPSSAKLVLLQQWDRDWHVHDFRAVQHVLERHWLPKKPKGKGGAR